MLQGTTTAPSGLTATAGDGPAVRLAWTAPLFPPPVTGYVVERAADEGFTDGSQDLHRSGRRRELRRTRRRRAGAPYFYRVRTEAAAGWSPWSAAAEVSLP